MWFKVDDSFYDHPKVFGLSDAAVALWTRAGSWAARYRTDGRVPAHVLARLSGDAVGAASELVAAGLWRPAKNGGYRFHDWAEYQPLRSQSDALRLAKQRGAIAANHRRWHLGRGLVDPDCALCEQPERPTTDRSTDRWSDQMSDRSANPPDPSRKDQPHVGVTAVDLLQDVVTAAPARDAHTQARTQAGAQATRTRPPGRSGLPHEAVIAALDATPSEAHAVVDRIRNERNPSNLNALTNALINNGMAQQMLAEHRAAVARAERADWGRRRREAAECEHGVPGGDWLHIDPPHRPVCLNCRLGQARAVG